MDSSSLRPPSPLSSLERPLFSPRTRAACEALLVTVLWSSSYVLIVYGLEEIPALTFAGLRYTLAWLVLLPLFVRAGGHRTVATCSRADLGLLVALGVLLYAVTQGAQFVALLYLNAATVSLVLTATPVLVALIGVSVLAERPTTRQWLGIATLVLGAIVYLAPDADASTRAFGLAVMALGLLGNALGAVLGRRINRAKALSPLAVTTVSMGVGSIALLATGLATQGLPRVSPTGWLVVGWLAVVNTAFAFTLWNRTLQTLSAVESSVINNTMLVQVAVLGWLVLGQSLSTLEVAGLVLVGAGALVVQLSGDES